MFIVLRMIWPYLLRYLMNRGAEYTAGYLQARHMRRLQQTVEPEIPETFSPQEAEIPPAPEIPVRLPPPPTPFLAGDVFWYTLSGILLGSALSIIVAVLVRKTD